MAAADKLGLSLERYKFFSGGFRVDEAAEFEQREAEIAKAAHEEKVRRAAAERLS